MADVDPAEAHFAAQRERHLAARIATAGRAGRARGDEVLRMPDADWDKVTRGLEDQLRGAAERANSTRVDLAKAEGEVERIAERLRARARSSTDPRLDPAALDAIPGDSS